MGKRCASVLRKKGSRSTSISEDSTLTLTEKQGFISSVCARASELKPIKSLVLFEGDKVFSFYRGIMSSNDSNNLDKCPYPARGWLDTPKRKQIIEDNILISGWAFAPEAGVKEININIDGIDYGIASYGINRPDVVSALSVFSDPNAPKLGFEFQLDTKALKKGRHRLLINIKGPGEIITHIPERIFYTR